VGRNGASVAEGAAINAELTSSLDSKKVKIGDTVNARTTEDVKSAGKVILPKGSKVFGHVTQASARSKGEPQSSLGIVFDKAVAKSGQEIPLDLMVQAVASPPNNISSGSDLEPGGYGAAPAARGSASGTRGMGSATSGVAGNATGTVNNTAGAVGGVADNGINAAANTAGNVTAATSGGLDSAGQLAANSRGVFGINGLTVASDTAGAANESIFTSKSKSVHLDSGTRLLLVTRASGRPGSQSQTGNSNGQKMTEPNSEPRPEPKKP
jgi:hypothetical protein